MVVHGHAATDAGAASSAAGSTQGPMRHTMPPAGHLQALPQQQVQQEDASVQQHSHEMVVHGHAATDADAASSAAASAQGPMRHTMPPAGHLQVLQAQDEPRLATAVEADPRHDEAELPRGHARFLSASEPGSIVARDGLMVRNTVPPAGYLPAFMPGMPKRARDFDAKDVSSLPAPHALNSVAAAAAQQLPAGTAAHQGLLSLGGGLSSAAGSRGGAEWPLSGPSSLGNTVGGGVGTGVAAAAVQRREELTWQGSEDLAGTSLADACAAVVARLQASGDAASALLQLQAIVERECPGAPGRLLQPGCRVTALGAHVGVAYVALLCRLRLAAGLGLRLRLHAGLGLRLLLHAGLGLRLCLHAGLGLRLRLHAGLGLRLLLHAGSGLRLCLHAGLGSRLRLHTGLGLRLRLHAGVGLRLRLHAGPGI
eukprot:364874-Chlamydomonas_euryale.AAC.6